MHGSLMKPTSSPASYANAHWYFLAALGAITAGFWPSFFRPLGTGSTWHTIHGTSATLWIVVLIMQSVLMSRGQVRYHRRVATLAVGVLLPVWAVSALYMIAAMFANPEMPPFLSPLLAFIDFPSILFLLVLVGLGIYFRQTPSAHKRFMAATVLLGFPPALTRLYARVLAPQVDFMMALHGSMITVEVILIALIAADWRRGEREFAYPLSLGFFVAVHGLMMPMAGSAAWRAFTTWYAALPVFA